jgi:hypothetical protein
MVSIHGRPVFLPETRRPRLLLIGGRGYRHLPPRPHRVPASRRSTSSPVVDLIRLGHRGPHCRSLHHIGLNRESVAGYTSYLSDRKSAGVSGRTAFGIDHCNLADGVCRVARDQTGESFRRAPPSSH